MSKQIKKDNLMRFVEDYLLLNTKLNSDEVMKTFQKFLAVIREEEFAKVDEKLKKKFS